MRIRLPQPLISSIVAVGAAALLGATATGSMSPVASVVANCKIAKLANNALGTYDPVVVNRTTDLRVAVDVLSLQCTRGAPGVTVSLSLGNNPVGNLRYMKRNAGLLQYVLYSDPAYTTPWDTTTLYSYASTSMAASALTVYTDVPAGQDVPTYGTAYTDTITATVNF